MAGTRSCVMPEANVTRRNLILILATTTALSALALTAARARDVPKVATGFVANILCSETFVSGLDPQKTFSETTAAMPGTGLISWALDYSIDRTRKDVTVTLFGLGRSHAVYREGMGCYLDHGGVVADVSLPATETKSPALVPEIAGPAVVAPANPQIAAALDRAFAEPQKPPVRHTRAVVVVKDGRVVAERYAEGFCVETPMLGFSATKSVISALTGILVRKGALTLDQPAPIAAWQGAGDPRHAITVDHLLRHTAGLAIGSSLEASLGAACEPVNRMKFMESDMAAYAESVELATPPGTAWNYNDGNFIILSHLIRNAAGGRAADVIRFAREELFAPLGMRNVTLEFDASGNPEGSTQMLATARDWARFGMLYLNDGVVGGKRILPEGWVKYSASPTPNGWVGYGAGFWTNLGDSFGASYRNQRGWPHDAFFAKGTIGQYVIIVPSERLVIVRLGRSPNWPPEVDGVRARQRCRRGNRRQG
jgi:CubicO group peptidase (beta-lactamase class C family)